MNYYDYKKTISSSKVKIKGQEYSQTQLTDWLALPSETTYLQNIKLVISKWFDSSLDFEISTSGSTGKPKIISLSKVKMFASAKNTIQYFDLQSDQKILLTIPADKVGGLMVIIRALVGNLDLYYLPPKLNPFEQLTDHEYDFCSLTPAQLMTIKDNPLAVTKLKKIKKILLGGSSISEQLLSFIKYEDNEYYHSFGMTETISHVAIKALNGRHKQKYFQAVGNVKFSVNQGNQLIVHAPEILESPLLTNDIVEFIDEQKIIWKGRLDNVVNSGGLKLIIEELEAMISHFMDAPFYLKGLPDPILGEKLVLLILETEQSENREWYKDQLMQNLNKNEVPKEIHFVSRFKYTDNGKLIRLSPNQLK